MDQDTHFGLRIRPQSPLSFQDCFLHLQLVDDVGNIKHLLWELLDIEEDEQVLSFHGKVLKDEDRLVDLHVRCGDSFRLSLRCSRVDSFVEPERKRKRTIDTPFPSQLKTKPYADYDVF